VGTHYLDDFHRLPDPDDPDKLFGGGVVEFGAQLHPIQEAFPLSIPHQSMIHSSYNP
jgi:hypothetical protein